jgi:tyrosyl-tRNA synthetase
MRGDEPAFPRREPGPIWECGTAASGRVSKQRGLRPRERETLALARMEESSSEAGRTAGHLARNAVDCLPRGALAERIAQGRPLRVKLGLDPTAPDIHLGHTVVLTKLREFQDAGHTVVLIVGDYTGRVGDPSGRSATRPVLSGEQIDANAETYRRQAGKILRDDRLEVRHNSEWLDMPMEDLFRLARHPTVAQLLERDDFSKRFAAAEPISLLELLYPVLQGYDSVCVEADVEIGGTDQTFNLLMGRSIQQAYGQAPQVVLTVPLLTGTDGVQKMSKSFGNHIGVTEPPGEMYGRTLRIPDEQIAQWFSLLLGEEQPAGLGPRDAKRALARALVTRFHGAAAAAEAEAGFDRVFIAHELPEEIDEAVVAAANGVVHLPAVIAEVFGISRSEARRRLAQGGVKLDGTTAAADLLDLPASELDGRVLQLGKRHFRRLRVAT